ncbi:class I SAM-dependent methyltransferase [Alphaproteobacteria bacterium]|nr:class I SAM-dependent methyltransferase [Alphaproteobacteria bacterium]
MNGDRNARKQYWDAQYTAYWKRRVEEASQGGASNVIHGDPKTEDDSVYERVFATIPPTVGSLLDVGCAWGRMFPLYKTMGLRVCGVDISDSMVAEAKRAWDGDPIIESIQVSEAESLPFKDTFFDNVAILAVFDATYQNEALGELFRVLKPGGHLYLTGKGHRYHPNDKPALDAEIGARLKGHPNYFTDVSKLRLQLESYGHRILGSYYFPRRGDFASFTFDAEQPDRFYEYFLVIERGPSAGSYHRLAEAVSQTYIDQAKID